MRIVLIYMLLCKLYPLTSNGLLQAAVFTVYGSRFTLFDLKGQEVCKSLYTAYFYICKGGVLIIIIKEMIILLWSLPQVFDTDYNYLAII